MIITYHSRREIPMKIAVVFSKNLKYAYPASQILITTSLAKQNSTHCKQLFQNRNEFTLAMRETQFT